MDFSKQCLIKSEVCQINKIVQDAITAFNDVVNFHDGEMDEQLFLDKVQEDCEILKEMMQEEDYLIEAYCDQSDQSDSEISDEEFY